ncbi:MAG: hypothetical protein AAF357_12115 [Verrucomicrobiota bacterium]
MKTDKNTQDKIDDTLQSVDAIGTVKVPPFFKEKTLHRLFSEKREPQPVWPWFTPKLQLATLVCVLILNAVAFIQLRETTYSESVNQFAESYELSTSTEFFLFNQP